MLKIQSVNHVSEHLSAIYPVYTIGGGSVSKANEGEDLVMLSANEGQHNRDNAIYISLTSQW